MSVATPRYDKDEVIQAASGRWGDIALNTCAWNPDHLDGRTQPCPHCGGDDRFNVPEDFAATGRYFCRGCGDTDKEGLTDVLSAVMYYNDCDFPEALAIVAEQVGVEPTEQPRWVLAQSFAKRGADKLPELARELGVSVTALERLGTGHNSEAWTFPETDNHGTVIGISRRYPNGRKQHYPGHKRGLMICDTGFNDLYCVEGATDTATLVDCGLDVIGRPSASGGAVFLKSYMQHCQERQVVIVGENDRKPNGEWPGLKGAISVATKLAESGLNACVALPPSETKDARDWRNKTPDGSFPESIERLSIKEAKAVLNPSAAQASTEVELVRTYDPTDRNDIGNSRHFAKQNADRLQYCHAWKKWIAWDGARWVLDGDGAALRLAKSTVHEMFTHGLAMQSEQIMELATTTASASKLRAMISLAAPELPIGIEDLDSNGWLLNCPNGTLDLRTGDMMEHQRHLNITKLCPTPYLPDSTAPRWEHFVREIFVDDDLISFVQRLMGYCLTGDVSEQKLPIFYGTGANGKSTLLNAFMDVVGTDYTMQSMPDFLMEKRGESHPTEKASLFGKRFVSCVETEASRRLAESTVKMLTGGEKIMARRMREDFWEFEPSHKLVLCTNHKPVVAGQDHGIWRRLLLVPFTQRFEGSRIDKTLPDKLRAEAPGILAWLVRGCIAWKRDGLRPPDIVTVATTAYRTKEDVIGRFIADECQKGSNISATFKSLFHALEAWCRDNGDDCPTKKALGTWLGENGFEKMRSNGVVWKGLMLKPDESETTCDFESL